MAKTSAPSKPAPRSSRKSADRERKSAVPDPPADARPATAGSIPPPRRGKATVRSEDHVRVPHYRRASPDAPAPTAADALSALGLQPTRALGDAEVRALIKTDDGVMLVADDILRAYRTDYDVLGLRDLTPETLEGLYERAAFVLPRVTALEEAALLALHQKLVALSDLVDSLLRIRRRVQALSQEDRDLGTRWASRLTYFDARYPGRGPAATPAEPAEPIAAPEAAPAAPQSPAAPTPAEPKASSPAAPRPAPSPAPRTPPKRRPK